MNHNPEYASQWKGRILVQYFAEETKNPEMKIEPISKENIQEASKFMS